MKKVYKMSGYTLHLIPTKKFKTISMSLRLQSPLKKETTTLRTLLTFVMIAATQDYPSTKKIASYLDDCYGARLSANISTKGKSQIININTSFVNGDYLPSKEDLLVKQIELMSDIFFKPYIVNQHFDNDIVDMKKKEIKERLQVNKDDKFSYSLDKLFEIMGDGQPLAVASTGYEEDISGITSQDLYNYFIKCINEDEKHLYVVGDIDESVVKVFDQHLQFPSHSYEYESSYIFKKTRKDVKKIIEKQDITQSKLNIGYAIDCDFQSKKHYAMTVLNAIFGGYSQSRLFKVVREKNSLCYYVSSSYDAFNGIVIVNAGIDAKDYYKTMELIQNQLKDLQSGNISEEEITLAKIMLENSLKKTNDEAGNMIALAYNRDITHKEETNEDYINKLMNVSKDELVDVANQIQLDSIFFLTGKDFDENN